MSFYQIDILTALSGGLNVVPLYVIFLLESGLYTFKKKIGLVNLRLYVSLKLFCFNAMQQRKNVIFVVSVGSLLLCLKLTADLKRWPRAQNELPTIKSLYMSEVMTFINEGSPITDLTNLEQKEEIILRKNISESLYKLAPNVFDAVPEEFLPKFRNPCWRSQLSGEGGLMTSPPLKCLPYFFLAGMPKSGTTDVHDKLHTHPQVFRARVKEPHWWTRKRFTGTSVLQYIGGQSINIAKQLVKGSDPSIIMGDSSASTFWDNIKWRQFFPQENIGPPHVNAEVISTVLPKSQIIVTFRDPTARLFSDFHYFNKHDYDKGPSIFHSQVKEYLRRFKSCLANKKDNRTCAYDLQTESKVRASIGLYSVYLRDWLKVFPRDQIKVIRLEDWQTNCTQMLPQLFEFLQLRKLDSTDIKKKCRRHPSNVNKRPTKQMLPETKQLLKEFYRPFNVELAQLLNDDKYLWEDSAL